MDEREVEEQEGGPFGCDDVVNGEPSYSTRILPNVQEFFENAKPLGLTIRKTQAFLNLIEKMMYHHPITSSPPPTAPTQKLKATNFPINTLRIGNWQRKSENEGELIAKLYYAKRKIVWEVLDEEVLPGNELKMKSKIEILWSNITAIEAILGDDHQHGILRIELDKAPLVFRETKPEPKKHTNWESNDQFDFTDGQVRISRIHCVSFPPKVLDKHYENLVQSDQHLFKLSREPFPSQRSPYFQQLSPKTVVMGGARPHPNCHVVKNHISGPSSASPGFFTGQPNGPLVFDEANLNVQMRPIDLVHKPNINYPNGHNGQVLMPNQTNNYCNGHGDAHQHNNIRDGPSNWTPPDELGVDYPMLPFVSPDDDK